MISSQTFGAGGAGGGGRGVRGVSLSAEGESHADKTETLAVLFLSSCSCKISVDLSVCRLRSAKHGKAASCFLLLGRTWEIRRKGGGGVLKRPGSRGHVNPWLG